MIDPAIQQRALDAATRNTRHDDRYVDAAGPAWPADDPGPPEPEPDEPRLRNGHHVAAKDVRQTDTPAHLRYPTLDWQRAFDGTPDETDWLVPDFIARGQSYSVVSQAKAGKSLLLLDAAAAAACGRSALGHPPRAPVDVLYVDCENTVDDIVERARDMGYRPEDLSRLHYLSFPSLPALDSPAGGTEIAGLAEHYDVALVVIDTIARVVVGEENSADTYRNLYRYTLLPLKAQRRAVVRLDHRGKGVNTGARGSSAKMDDVDAVWQLSQASTPDGDVFVQLKLERQRGSSHPDELQLTRESSPHLRHVIKPADYTPSERQRIGECIEALKHLRMPADAGARLARVALREKGHKFGNTIIAAAIKARKLAATCPEVDRDTEQELFGTGQMCPRSIGDTSQGGQ